MKHMSVLQLPEYAHSQEGMNTKMFAACTIVILSWGAVIGNRAVCTNWGLELVKLSRADSDVLKGGGGGI